MCAGRLWLIEDVSAGIVCDYDRDHDHDYDYENEDEAT